MKGATGRMGGGVNDLVHGDGLRDTARGDAVRRGTVRRDTDPRDTEPRDTDPHNADPRDADGRDPDARDTDARDTAPSLAAAPALSAASAAPAPLATASALAAELLRRADEDRQLTRQAHADPTPLRKHRIAQCHRDNGRALAAIVDRHGWPHALLVGSPASTAALMILLHAPDLGFRLRCRDLIAHATADGHVPAIHLAYIADQCAVDLGQPQFYGTRINPRTLRPYPIRRPGSVDERRGDVGLGPLQEQLRALRITG